MFNKLMLAAIPVAAVGAMLLSIENAQAQTNNAQAKAPVAASQPKAVQDASAKKAPVAAKKSKRNRRGLRRMLRRRMLRQRIRICRGNCIQCPGKYRRFGVRGWRMRKMGRGRMLRPMRRAMRRRALMK